MSRRKDDTLGRDRLPANIIDRVDELERVVRRLSRQVERPGAGGLTVAVPSAPQVVYRFELIVTSGVLQLALRRVR